MKKHELLKYAYENYPKGTAAFWVKGKERILSGVYEILLSGDVYDNESNFYVYDQPKWAEILKKPSILDGKCAIQVNNEREFGLLMEHYESKGWVSRMGIKPIFISYNAFCDIDKMLVSYSNEFCLPHKFKESISCDLDIEYVWSYINPDLYRVIRFVDLAKEIKIIPPALVMRTNDCVDLYEGDEYYECVQYRMAGSWTLISSTYNASINSNSRTHPNMYKAFRTKEAAEFWIEEQNKPKEVTIKHNDNETSVVSLDQVVISVFDKGQLTHKTYLSMDAVEAIWLARQSLLQSLQ